MAWMLSARSAGGSHSSGSGLKLSFRARTETSESRRPSSELALALGANEKLSSDEMRWRDMLGRAARTAGDYGVLQKRSSEEEEEEAGGQVAGPSGRRG